jgi:predicted RNA-binding protein with PIN domain
LSLIIDGHNVLFAIAPHRGRTVSEALEAAREELTSQLLRHHRLSGEAITVVYDSRRFTGGASPQESLPGIRILTSHPPRTADDDILRLVRESTAPRTLRVVTSDRELRAACVACGAAVVGAMTFYRELLQEATSTVKGEEESRIKTQSPSDDEVREWLDIFGGDPKERPQ